MLGVFTVSGTMNTATGRIPFAPEGFTPILRIQIDPRRGWGTTAPPRAPGDLFETVHARPGEVSVSGSEPRRPISSASPGCGRLEIQASAGSLLQRQGYITPPRAGEQLSRNAP